MADNREPLDDLLTAVESLVKPIADPVWQNKLNGRGRVVGRTLAVVNRAAPIVQLRQAITASLGSPTSTISGGGAQMGGLNVAAFTMYEDIDGRIRAAWFDISGERSKEFPEVVLSKWQVVVRHRFGAELTSENYVRSWRSAITGWVKGIEGMFNPETVKELKGPCPNCELPRVVNGEGIEQSALYLHYSPANEPEAVCRSCGWNETGPRRLLELGYHLGATVDEDALREMGVIV